MTACQTQPAPAASQDEGSVLPLTLGYAMLALVTILLCANATSLYLEQKRLDSLAGAAALAGADGFSFSVEGDEVRAALDDMRVRDQAEQLVADVGGDTELVAAGTPDGVSARVTLTTTWRPLVITMFVPDGVPLASTATSRTALN